MKNNQNKKITFISTFPPIMCGIADFLARIINRLPEDSWQVISFKLRKSSGFRVLPEKEKRPNAYYILPRTDPSSMIKKVNRLAKNSVVWIQHEFGIWKDTPNFIKFVLEIKSKKVITFHTLHFQSNETPYGLESREYQLLESILPLIDAITVFSDGVYLAVCGAFPQHKKKVLVLRHHCSIFPRALRKEARIKLIEDLINSPKIKPKTKKELEKLKEEILKKNVKIIGDIGFIAYEKGSEIIYLIREELEKIIKQKVISMYIGTIRDPENLQNAEALKKLKSFHDGERNFFIDLYIPEKMFPIYLRAFDVIIYWPIKCTQSGRLAFAQGIGACVVGKDQEGVGESLKLSTFPTVDAYGSLINVLAWILKRPDSRDLMERMARIYARKFNVSAQAKKYVKLVDVLTRKKQKLPLLDRGYGNYLYQSWKEKPLPEWF